MSSDEASSRVTYTSISSDYEEPSDAGSPRVIVYGYDGLPMHLVDPPSPNYVPGPVEPKPGTVATRLRAGPSLSPGYITDTDLKEDSKNESEDGPADYPADRWDDDEDDDDDDDDDLGMMLTMRMRSRHLMRRRRSNKLLPTY
ncbi:hypothetical protein Tco_0502573 [Tanacetum coccineum]